MSEKPHSRSWDNFFGENDFQDADLRSACAEYIVVKANKLIRQAIADAVTVYGQEIALFPSENSIITVRMMSWLPEKDYFAREKRDTHSAKLIAIKQIGT